LGDKIYLGTILGVDGYYYKGVLTLDVYDILAAQSVDYGGDIRAFAQDDNFIYVGGDITKKVYKLNKSDLSIAAQSVDYGGAIYALTQDDNFIYVGGYSTNKVYKLKKSDLSIAAQSVDYGGTIWALTQDDNFIYVGGDTTNKVYKFTGNLYTLVSYRRVE
jgi:glutamine cyclotransferase